LVVNIFISTQVRSNLFNDQFVKWESADEEEESFENRFIYNLPEGFNDENIKSPLAYLLDKMITELNSGIPSVDYEKETALQFLALNSN